MLREFGGSLSAVYGIVLLLLLVEFTSGKPSYDGFLQVLRSPPVLVLTAIALFFILAHAITWFYLIGKSQPVMSSYRSPSAGTVFALMLLVFVAVSVATLFVVFGGL
jgi:succinate dehydrogenase subunit C